MRYLLLLLILIFCTISPFAQNTFISPYDLDLNQVVFNGMILDNDTLIISGLARSEESPNQSGILLNKIDTSGNIIWTNLHFSEEGLNYSLDKRQEGLIKALDNSGYYILGHVFEHSTGVLLKFDNNGQFLWQKEYSDSLSLQDYFEKIIEVDDGYFILGTKQKLDYDLAIFLIKIDFEGNKQWEKYYEIASRDKRFNTILRLNENEYVIGSASTRPTSSGQGNTPSDLFGSILTGVDIEGNILWEWESDLSQEEGGAGNLYFDGNWSYTSGRIAIEEDGSVRLQPSLVVRDNDFNLLSTQYYDQLDYPQNSFYDMIPMQEGGFLAVGINSQDTTGLTFPTYGFGWMMRLDAYGNTLWERLDLTPIDTFATFNYWATAAELESGSIIATGTARTYIDLEWRDWGSIIKVDKHGCIETLCAVTGIDDLKVFQKEVTIYPNPFHDQINIDTEGKYQVAVFDLLGRQVFYKQEVDDFASLDLSGLLAGNYFVKIIFEEGQKVFKVVKVE